MWAVMGEMGELLLVLTLGAGIGWLSERFKFPNAVAQVVLGVLLGSALLGWVGHSPTLHLLGEIGVVILLGVAGLEVGLERLKAAGWPGVGVAVLGIGFSFAGGYVVGAFNGSPSAESLYLGLALAATSIGISVEVLRQFGLINHKVAEVVIAAAVIDDVIALFLLAAAHGVLSDGLSGTGMVVLVATAIVVLTGVFWLARAVTRWGTHHGLIDRAWARGLWILSIVFVAASLTDTLQLSAVVGGFFAGLGVGEGLDTDSRERGIQWLSPLMLVSVPFFFVMIGVQAQWDVLQEPATLTLIGSLVLIGFIAKVGGGVIGAIGIQSLRERWLIGFGMVARGEVGLVIATLGYEQGHLTHHVYVALVLVTIALSIIGPLGMAPLARHVGVRLDARGGAQG